MHVQNFLHCRMKMYMLYEPFKHYRLTENSHALTYKCPPSCYDTHKGTLFTNLVNPNYETFGLHMYYLQYVRKALKLKVYNIL